MSILLFDIGGTKTRIALSRDKKSMDEIRSIPTEQNFESAMAAMKGVVQELKAHERIEYIIGDIAAMFDEKHEVIFKSPNLRGWEGKNVKLEFEKVFGQPVTAIENDCALAALGETHFGAARKQKVVAYVTVSTGVGGARVIDWKLDTRTFDFEPGQQIIDYKNGLTLEKLISGAAIEKRCGKKAYEIPANDPVWDELADILAIGLYNLTIHWVPDIIVLGGSMILGNPSISIARTEKKLKELLSFYPKEPQVIRAALGDESALLGGLALLDIKQKEASVAASLVRAQGKN